MVKISPSQFYSLENVIRKVKGAAPGGSVASGLFTRCEIGIEHVKGVRWNTELERGCYQMTEALDYRTKGFRLFGR